MARVSVIQPGARLHYAVPAILARAGLLGTLFTDLHGDHRWIRTLDRLLPRRHRPQIFDRLAGRRLPAAVARRHVVDMPLATLGGGALVRLGFDRRPHGASRLLSRLEAEALGPGDAVYSVLVNEDLETLRRLKARGVKIVHECMLTPDAGLRLAEERRRHPGIETAEPAAAIAAGRDRDGEKYRLADLVLVPSDGVRRAVAALGCPAGKIAVVPYGFAQDRPLPDPAPEPGRILCVGAAGLRKGTHILAAAARALAGSHPCITLRVAGRASEAVRTSPLFAGPRYLGQLAAPALADEYRRADVFVLPTLAEGMALAHLEAMAAGLPVITTPACGSVVRDGRDGFLVPERDPDAIAGRIAQIVSDRALREKMSRNARASAGEYSLERYAERLLAALAPVLAP